MQRFSHKDFLRWGLYRIENQAGACRHHVNTTECMWEDWHMTFSASIYIQFTSKQFKKSLQKLSPRSGTGTITLYTLVSHLHWPINALHACTCKKKKTKDGLVFPQIERLFHHHTRSFVTPHGLPFTTSISHADTHMHAVMHSYPLHYQFATLN